MYLPKHFSQGQEAKVRKLIEQNAFVTVLSFPKNDRPFINHLAVMFSSVASKDKVLIGHMAKKNPQWKHFKENPQGTILVNGPHTYVTPRWYKSGRDVPTWNYAVAHLHGNIDLIEEFEAQVEILEQLSKFYEKSSPAPWGFALPDDLMEPANLTSAIVSFKFHIEKIEAKFKLSQSRSAEDRASIVDGLLERTDEMSRSVRKMMLEND